MIKQYKSNNSSQIEVQSDCRKAKGIHELHVTWSAHQRQKKTAERPTEDDLPSQTSQERDCPDHGRNDFRRKRTKPNFKTSLSVGFKATRLRQPREKRGVEGRQDRRRGYVRIGVAK
jgi:hypothetical protein